MKNNKLTIRFLYLILLLFVLIIGYSIFIFFSNKPPLGEINAAREAIALAKKKMATHYAYEKLKEAENLYQQSVEEWNKQNKKILVLRDYSLAEELAVNSGKVALDAVDEASESRDKLKKSVEEKIVFLNEKIEYFEKYYENLALSRSVLKSFNSGKTRFLESKIEFRKNNYMQAIKLLYKAEENIIQAGKAAHIKLVNFYNDYPKWESNIRLAYDLSKKGRTVLLVDKMKASIILLKAGKDYKTYPVEFGNNWMGDKSMVGDKATPEGVYKIISKKSGSKTKYYKALLLNYPNEEDRKRFDQQKSSGKIAKNAGIGGMIEIHGEGGKGIHWTEGCIALANNDMDTVYRFCTTGTQVIIVGSGESLEDYLK